MSISVEIHKKLDTFDLDVSFHSTSRRIGILGASGCGKSMTLKSIAGIETPDDGKITVEGRTLFDKKEKVNLKPQKRNVGYLFQNYALFPTMTVEKNIAAGLKGSRQENAARVRQMVEKATTVVCLATMLHTIATGNMTPSYTVTPEKEIRPVFLYTVDADEFVVNKLLDRGSLSATTIVTNVQDFIMLTVKGLGIL